MQARVAVIILNWNGWKDTIELLASLDQCTYQPLLIVVIDNSSTDSSVSEIKNWLINNETAHNFIEVDDHRSPPAQSEGAIWGNGKYYVLIESKTNLGFCVGNNFGMGFAALAEADYMLILNNDTLVSENFLQPMIDVAESDPGIGLVGGVITYCHSPEVVWWAGGKFNKLLIATRLFDGLSVLELPHHDTFETQWISGCMMLIPTRTYSALGGYFEPYFIWSEEWDYSLKVSRAGFKLVVATKSRICHKIGRSLGIMKPLNYYYGIRNQLIFQKRYLNWYIWYPYLLYFLMNRIARFLQLVLQGRSDLAITGTQAIFDYFRGKTGKWQIQQD